MKKIYIISRVHTPFYNALLEKRYHHTGSPAYYNFIKYVDRCQQLDYELIFLLDKYSSKVFTSGSVHIDGLKQPVTLIPYKKFINWNNNLFNKLELVINKIFQYFYVFYILENRAIYYIDRENILFANLLSLKKGLIVFRVLGITKKIYNILFHRSGIIHLLYKRALNTKKSLIICSNDGSWAEKTKERIDNNNFFLLFNGTDTKYCENAKVKNNVFTITYISRLEKGKGHLEFLKMIKNIKTKGFNNFNVCIIGGGSLDKDLKQYSVDVDIDKYITFTGEIEHTEVNQYLNNTDLFVSLNYFGIFGNNVIEASSKGIPIIALNSANVSLKFKKDFYLVDEDKIDDASNFIIELANDDKLYKKYSEKSHNFFNKNIKSWKDRINHEIKIILKQYDNETLSASKMNKTLIHQLSLTGIGGVQQSFVPYLNKALIDSKFEHKVYGMHELEDNYKDIEPYYTNINKSIFNKLKFIYCLYSKNYIVHFYNNIGSKQVNKLLNIIPSSNVIFHERGTVWNAKDEDGGIYLSNANKANIILANSNASKIMLSRRFGIDDNKIKVIYNGFLSKKYEFIQKDKKRYSDKFSVGYIGRLDTPKGVHILIESAKKLRQYDFFIAGTGVWKDLLVKQSTGYNNIKFVGRVKDPLEFINKMDLIVVPSIREPLGNTVIEAGFCRKPVIASNIDGIAEIIEDRKSGILLTPLNDISIKDLPKNAVPIPKVVVNPVTNNLVSPKEIDSNELSEAIEELANDRSKRDGYAQELYNLVREKFTIENYLYELEKVYQSI